MTCTELEAALQQATENVFHYAAPPGYTEHIVWAEYQLNQVWGDDGSQLIIPRVQIDVYSQDSSPLESHALFQTVLGILDDLELCWSLQDTGYDHDAAATRLIIQCDVA